MFIIGGANVDSLGDKIELVWNPESSSKGLVSANVEFKLILQLPANLSPFPRFSGIMMSYNDELLQ